jgi:hypothetical protein
MARSRCKLPPNRPDPRSSGKELFALAVLPIEQRCVHDAASHPRLLAVLSVVSPSKVSLHQTIGMNADDRPINGMRGV